jgi:hypothetical protein
LQQPHNEGVGQVFTKEKLLGLKPRIEKVDIEGDCVYVRSMTVSERDQWEQLILAKRDAGKLYNQFRASLLVRTICDEHGSRLFDDADVDKVSEMAAEVADSLYDVGARLSGISKEAVQEVQKN